MGFRLTRGIKLGKFGRINLGKKGASLSVGVRGARLNFGSKGTRMTVGLPGTGLSHTSRLGGPAVQSSSSGSSTGGCLKVFLIGLALVFVLPAAREKPLATLFTMGIMVIPAIALLRWRDSRRAANARALAESAAAEQQRQASLAQAEVDRKRNERWSYLCTRYGEESAHKIFDGRLWVGCTVDMMIEILGPPIATDEKVLKTKTNRTFKYRPTGVNRYALRVYVEDDEVVGWEDKSDV